MNRVVKAFGMLLWVIILSSKLGDASRAPIAEPAKLGSLGPKRLKVPVASPMNRSSREPKLSAHYPFEQIRQEVSKDRVTFASCLSRGLDVAAPRIRMTMSWESSGALRQLSAVPLLGHSTQACLEEAIRKWRLPPHPGNQPFSYTVTLMLGKG
jgi:hypothetical protein